MITFRGKFGFPLWPRGLTLPPVLPPNPLTMRRGPLCLPLQRPPLLQGTPKITPPSNLPPTAQRLVDTLWVAKAQG